jgi:hypothetical protein
MGAQNSDAVALLSVFVATGVGIALVLLVLSGSIAALLALARGGSPRGYWRECAECLPRAVLIVSLASALLVVGYAAVFGR